MERGPREVFDELDNHLNGILQAAGNAGGRRFTGFTENPDEEKAHGDGPAHGVQVNGPKAHFTSFFGGVRQRPAILWVFTKGQVLQVVLDIVSR